MSVTDESNASQKDDLFVTAMLDTGMEKEEYQEMHCYESGRPLTAKELCQFDILTWWDNYAGEFSHVAKMAADHLAVPMSSANAERLFSDCRRLITFDRNRLLDQTVSACLQIKSWIRAFGRAWVLSDDDVWEETDESEDE